MVERGIGPKSLVERMNGYRELSRCSAMCSRFDASGFDMMPLSGVPYFLFYRPRESTGYNEEKRRTRKRGSPSGSPGLSFPSCEPR